MRACLLVTYFLSGAASFVYQVVWLRMLYLSLGTNIYAINVILAASLLGGAIGSRAGGRLCGGRLNLLVLYGICEGCTGLFALASPRIFAAGSDTLHAVLVNHALTPAAQTALTFLMGFVILLVPSILLSAAYPVLVAFLQGRRDATDGDVGLTYFVNLVGGAVGVTAGSYWLVYTMGHEATVRAMALVNLAICLLCIPAALAQSHRVAPPAEQHPPPGGEGRSGAALFLAGIFLFGAATFGLQVAWVRTLRMIIGSSPLAFAMMNVAFLVGMAYGALAERRAVKEDLPGRLAAVSLGAGGCLVLSIAVVPLLPELYYAADPHTAGIWYDELFKFAVAFFSIIGVTVFLGMMIPLAVRGVVACSSSGNPLARVYAMEMLGGVAGLAAVTALIVAFGIQLPMALTAVCLLAFAACVALRAMPPGGAARRIAALAVALAVAALAIPPWSPRAMMAGLHMHGNRSFYGQESIIHYRQGFVDDVGVVESRRFESIVVSGHRYRNLVVLIDISRIRTLLAHLAAPGESSVLWIGVGGGTHIGQILQYPVKHLDGVDINGSILEMNRTLRFFGNFDFLHDPRFRFIENDGRLYVAHTRERYDLIWGYSPVMETFCSTTLLNREQFEHYRDILKPGGVVGQIANVANWGQLKVIIATFRSVFPYVKLYGFSAREVGRMKTFPPLEAAGRARPFKSTDLLTLDDSAPMTRFTLLVGSMAPLKERDHPGMKPWSDKMDLLTARLDPSFSKAPPMVLAANMSVIEKLVRGVPVSTDDLPVLEGLTNFQPFVTEDDARQE